MYIHNPFRHFHFCPFFAQNPPQKVKSSQQNVKFLAFFAEPGAREKSSGFSAPGGPGGVVETRESEGRRNRGGRVKNDKDPFRE